MRNKAILVSFVALFAMILTLNAVSAYDTFAHIDRVEVNGVQTSSGPGFTYVGQVSDTVPIEVEFTALQDVDERVKVKVSIEGYKDDIEQYVIMRTPLEAGVRGYVARLSLKLPSTMDLDPDALNESTKLQISISAKNIDPTTETRNIRMEKDLYSLNILSIDAADKITAGSTVDMIVVVQNNGNQRLDNVYVKASIPELGIERKVYYGDLDSNQDESYDNIRDATERKIYLTIPRSATPGTYNIEVEAYNYDVSSTAKKKIEVSGLTSGVLPTSSAKTIAVGEETSFDLVVVNPNDQMIVYSITPEESKGLSINVEQPIVTIAAQSSATVKVKVKALSSAEEGTHLVTVNVNSDTGLVKKVSYSLNVEKTTSTTPTGTTVAANGVLILTVVLVIIFVVLLIVLIVLLTRKPAETEEFGETSYY